MRDALRFEWVRLRTIRSTYWLICCGLGLNAAVALLFAYSTRDRPLDARLVQDTVTAGGAGMPLPVLAVFLAVLGIYATAHEYRYNTIQPTLTTVPQRARLLTAKLLLVGAVATAAGLVAMALNVAAGMLVWHRVPDLTEPPLGPVLTGYVLLSLLWALAGAGLGQLFRNVPGPLVFVLIVPMLVENLLLRLSFEALTWLQPVVRFLPFTAGMQLISYAGEVSGGDETEVHMLARCPSGAVFVVFVAAVVGGAMALFRRRDA